MSIKNRGIIVSALVFSFLYSFSQDYDTLFLKPGPEQGKDAVVRSCYPTINEGDHWDFLAMASTISSVPFTDRALIEFDLGSIPEQSTIVEAKLSLFYSEQTGGPGHDGENQSYLLKITEEWDEHEITWNTQPSVSFENPVYLPTSTNQFQDYLDIDVTELITDFYNSPDLYHGFTMRLIEEVPYRTMTFSSSDQANPDRWPELVIICTNSGEKNAICFDGIDDYVDLGYVAGNGIRTMELWFKPAYQIDNSITNFITLIARNNGSTINEHEFNLSFVPVSGNKGKLAFIVEDGQGIPYSVYSDSTLWNAGQWYHAACVIHPQQGMMLFIDGKKQSTTTSYYYPTAYLYKSTSLGRWGDTAVRFFQGCMDDVRFSSDAIYSDDFTPPCPDIQVLPSTIGLWNLNEITGNLAIDSSLNNNDGVLFGTHRIIAEICSDTINGNNFENFENCLQSAKVFPNPSLGIFKFEYANPNHLEFMIVIYNSLGQLIYCQKTCDNFRSLDLTFCERGIYFYQLKNNLGTICSGKIIKE